MQLWPQRLDHQQLSAPPERHVVATPLRHLFPAIESCAAMERWATTDMAHQEKLVAAP